LNEGSRNVSRLPTNRTRLLVPSSAQKPPVAPSSTSRPTPASVRVFTHVRVSQRPARSQFGLGRTAPARRWSRARRDHRRTRQKEELGEHPPRLAERESEEHPEKRDAKERDSRRGASIERVV